MNFSPSVVGMLWPVQDSETDELTAYFLSSWLPSAAPIPWKNVNKTLWLKAQQTGKLLNQILLVKGFTGISKITRLNHRLSGFTKLEHWWCVVGTLTRVLGTKGHFTVTFVMLILQIRQVLIILQLSIFWKYWPEEK